jgi:hypothetical protein
MKAKTRAELDRVRTAVDRTRRLSDRIVGIGPFSLGLDGVLAWIPGAGALYSVAAGGMLMVQAARARASPKVMARMAALLAADTFTDIIPIPLAPAVVDMVFTGHKWAADVLLCEMERTYYYPGTRGQAEQDPEFRLAAASADRFVFLGDA